MLYHLLTVSPSGLPCIVSCKCCRRPCYTVRALPHHMRLLCLQGYNLPGEGHLLRRILAACARLPKAVRMTGGRPCAACGGTDMCVQARQHTQVEP